MKNFLKKGLVLLAIYIIFTAYLFLASERINRLEENDQLERVNVTIIYSE